MRNGYNQELGRVIIAEREENIPTRHDVNGNVIRDYKEEIRILSESENKNILPEIPIIVFDGCLKFDNHIKTENIKPIVRQVKLAPLGKSKRLSAVKILLQSTNEFLGWLVNRGEKAPLFNRKNKRLKKLWIINTYIVKKEKTNNYNFSK